MSGGWLALIIVIVVVVLYLMASGSSSPDKPSSSSGSSSSITGAGTGTTVPPVDVPPPTTVVPAVIVPSIPVVVKPIVQRDGTVDNGILKGTLLDTAYPADSVTTMLTNPVQNTTGTLNYVGTLPAAFSVKCDVKAYGGDGADGFGFYFNKAVPTRGETEGNPGFNVVIQEYWHYMAIYDGGKNMAYISYYNDTNWHTIQINVNNEQVVVLWDGKQVMQGSVDRKAGGGNNFGVSSRCGGSTNYHAIKNYSVVAL